ncbi:MAG: hypothetical protein GX090_06175 [Firmicutes bacterium]|nr:hypothetical protein [Bacillota bacterium]
MGKALRVLAVAVLLLAGRAEAAGRVRLVVMDGVNLEHLVGDDLPAFRFILEHGAVGLANVNTAGGRTAENAAITLSAGSRALGPGANLICRGDEGLESGRADEVYTRRTGIAVPAAALVMPDIALIREANAQLLHTVRVGYLADTLLGAGRQVAAVVNADDDEIRRPSAAIACTGAGLVMAGQVDGALLRPAGDAPFGRRADISAFIQALDKLEAVDLVVVDPGDTARAHAYGPLVMADRREYFRAQALRELDQLLAHLLARHGRDDLLLVTSLQPCRVLGEEEGKWLAPVLAYGKGFAPGLLTSATTRRRGIVANIDITAAILNHFGLYSPGEIHGQPLSVIPADDAVTYLLRREREIAGVYRLRPPLIKGFIGVIIVLVGLAVSALVWQWRRRRLLRLAIAAVAASPLVLLLLGLMPGSYWIIAAWPALAFMLAWELDRLPPRTAMPLLGAATVLAVGLDALGGGWLQQRSLLGYDAIAGARYYGIGNEFMGVLLGSTLLAVSNCLTKRKGTAALICALVTLMLLLPGVGANFGGTLAAAVGFAAALAGLEIFASKKHRKIAVPAGLGFAAALLAFNLGGAQSHVGRFFAAVFASPAEFWLAVRRKLDMAWRLVRWSWWSRAFAVLFVVAVWMTLARRRILSQKLGPNWPYVRGTIAAALAALALNDSGVVAAATTLIYLTMPLLYYELSSSSRLMDSHSR